MRAQPEVHNTSSQCQSSYIACTQFSIFVGVHAMHDDGHVICFPVFGHHVAIQHQLDSPGDVTGDSARKYSSTFSSLSSLVNVRWGGMLVMSV